MHPLLFKFASVIAFACVLWTHVSCQTKLPPGYHAFETGSRKHGSPPRVRPPPYLPAEVPCPAANGFMYSPRDTLCGDLNKAFIPRNPMGQAIHDQPYPFELIKNKTLHFLARSLPFLKEDIDSIPKVVKLSKPEPQSADHSSSYYDYAHVKKRSVVETKPAATSFWRRRSAKSQLFPSNNWNLTEARQKACEQKDGLMCQLAQSLGGNGFLSQAANVISTAQMAANTAQNLNSLVSLLHHFSASSDQPSKSFASQIASALGAGSTSLPQAGEEGAPVASGSSNFNPVLAVLDFLASNSHEKSAVSTLLPARRKKPMDLDELASEAAASIATNKVPPTPCPSLEEYVAPVFARNYQGVWKYIVQIPHEGYFTQTVQKTSCVKTKCDFMDGSCHESPRWVSLLVAEIFYPDARFPNPMSMPSPNSGYSHEHFASSHGISSYQQPMKGDKRQPHSLTAQHIANQIKLSGGWRSIDEETQQASSSKPQPESESTGSRRMRRQVVEEPANDVDGKNKAPQEERECDGVDKIGCYTIRVYYDWFLVPGSCKCWKKTSQGSLDTLKKIFIGK